MNIAPSSIPHSDDEANKQRIIAAQIVWNLWKAKQVGQLRLLAAQIAASLQALVPEPPKKEE
jgi:hypothetical protein